MEIKALPYNPVVRLWSVFSFTRVRTFSLIIGLAHPMDHLQRNDGFNPMEMEAPQPEPGHEPSSHPTELR